MASLAHLADAPEREVTPEPCGAGRPQARPGKGFAVPFSPQWGYAVPNPHRCVGGVGVLAVAELMDPPMVQSPREGCQMGGSGGG